MAFIHPQKKRRRRIDRSMIGEPMNFVHLTHIGSGDMAAGEGLPMVRHPHAGLGSGCCCWSGGVVAGWWVSWLGGGSPRWGAHPGEPSPTLMVSQPHGWVTALQGGL